MSSDKTYNGWTNYETWNVALWIGNDEGSARYWECIADGLLEENTEMGENSDGFEEQQFDTDSASSELARMLKDDVAENAPDLGSSCYADLLNAALGEVNWYEIAEGMIARAKGRAPP